MYRKHFLISIFIFVTATDLWANSQSQLSLFQVEWTEQLDGKTLTSSAIWQDSVVSLVPDGFLAQKMTLEAENRAKGISVASLVLVPYPLDWSDQSELERKLQLYNLLYKISTLQGFRYAEHNKKVHCSESYTIADPEDKKSKADDPVAQTLPATDTISVCREDTYKISDTKVFVDITNLTTLKFLGIPFVNPKDILLYFSVTHIKEGILLYTSMTLATLEPKGSFLFWSLNLADESMHRIGAYQHWSKKGIVR